MTRDAQRLPLTDFGSPNLQNAYQLVIAAESSALDAVDRMDCRVVGYLMINLYKSRSILGDAPLTQIVQQVTSTDYGDTIIYKVGKYYRQNLIHAFRTTGPLPRPPSPQSFRNLQEMIQDAMSTSTSNHRTLQNRALIRDNFRCMITGEYDETTYNILEKSDPSSADQIQSTVATNYCHIIGETTIQRIQRTRREGDTNILTLFGLTSLVDRVIQPGGINDLSNILTLRPELHLMFNHLKLWFEGTETPNEYNICVSNEKSLRAFQVARRRIQFRVNNIDYINSEQQRLLLPLPDPKLLAIHAICAKVAHLSGAAEHFDLIDREREEGTVLEEDGSSAALLDELLSGLVLRR
ncbi:hypothetical protein BDN72DRAFT_881367, partial [Pluteus cervinus]